MYSQPITEQSISKVIDRIRIERNDPKFRLVRFPSDVISEMVEHIDSLINKQTGNFTRDLTAEESRFIENDLMMCQLDFQYFCENYATIQLARGGNERSDDRPEGWAELDNDAKFDDDDRADSGGVLGKFVLNGMQLTVLKKIAALEEKCFEALRRGAPVNGILLIVLKARQLGASMLIQALLYHRTAFFHHINALTASMNDKATQRLHRRFERIHDHLPRWMRPTYQYWPKDRGVTFDNGSMMELQDGRQGDDLGKGEAWHAWHVTEASIFPRPEDHFDEGLFPATAYGMVGGFPVLACLETTAKGKIGWFHDFFLQVKSGTAEGGAGRFTDYFGPFYLIDATDQARGQRSRYRLEPPSGWEPSLNTKLVAQKVIDTSSEYTLDGLPVRLHRDVLYWYEATRLQYYRKGKLNVFLQNYPVTWEEAFQHTAAGAFTSETIERLDNNCSKYDPWPYRLITDDEIPTIELSSDLPIHHIAGYHLGPMDRAELDRDPRGVIWLWEQPDERYSYQSGCDPTGGIPGWQRAFRTQNDVNTDNGTIEIFRKGKLPQRCDDCNGLGWLSTSEMGTQVECEKCEGRGRLGGRAIQVAEFAAPIDGEELALYAFILGRLYRGTSDMDECPLIVESNNTGLITIRKLLSTFKHSNLYQHRTLDGVSPKYMNSYGWYSSPQSKPILCARSRLVVMRRDVEVRSRWMVKEYSDAIVKVGEDSGKEVFFVPPGGGRHDDRMIASFLAYWAMFDWSEADVELAEDSVRRELPPARNFAATDASASEQQRSWNDAVEAMFGEFDLQFGHFEDCSPDCRETHAPSDEEMADEQRYLESFAEDDEMGDGEYLYEEN